MGLLLLCFVSLWSSAISRSAINSTWPTPDVPLCGRPAIPPRTSNWPLDQVQFGVSTPGSFPWHVQVINKGEHICGAAIISKDWIVSAAHCFTRDHSEYLFRAGTHKRIIGNNPNAQVRNLTTIIKHGRYTGITMRYDIALVHLNESLVFSDFVHPICLPAFDVHSGTCYLSGWEVADGFTDLQHQIALQLLPNRVCNQKEYYDTMISPRMRCAGDALKNYSHPCQGDSGGPLVCQVDVDGVKTWELQGILSWTVGCNEDFKPAVFMRLAPFRKWIVENIRKYEAFMAVKSWIDFEDPFKSQSTQSS